MRKRLRRWVRRLIALVLLVLLGAAALRAYQAHEDARHARFFKMGSAINQFLKHYGQVLQDAFRAGDPGPLLALYADDYQAPDRGYRVLVPAPNLSDVEVGHWQEHPAPLFTRAELAGDVQSYFHGLRDIAEVIVKIDLIEECETTGAVTLTVKFILDGTNAQGALIQDRLFFRWHLRNEAGRDDAWDWKITRDELVEGVRVAGTGQGFLAPDPATLGIDFKHERDPKLDLDGAGANLRFGVIGHAGGGVSVVDYDNDGKPDIFFSDGKRCRLFHNEGRDANGCPRFTDVTGRAGLDGLDQANAGLFADVDNDGYKDLFVVRYCAPCKFFHNNGDGTFSDRTREMGLDLDAPCMAACFLDYDRDGFVDLYVAVYGDAFHDIPRLPFFAQNGGKNRLFRNQGGRRFVDVTDASGTGDTGWSLAVAAADYDNDGYPDLAVANDFGKKTLYHNNGDGTFTEMTQQAGVLDFSGGMAVAFADFEDTGQFGLYFANINSNQRWFGEEMTVNQYMRNVARTRWYWEDLGEYRTLYQLVGSRWHDLGKQIGKGNSLFRNNGDGTFSELTGSHTHRAGWGWGVAFFDMANDTRLDLFAANGWISNKPGTDL